MRKEQGEQAVPCANGGMMQRLKKCADGGGIMQYSTIPLVARAANAMRPSPPLETGGRTIPTMSVQPGPSLQAAQAPVQAQSYKSRIDQAEDEAVNGSPKKMRSGGLVKKSAMKRR
jgi:hypothetical protein